MRMSGDGGKGWLGAHSSFWIQLKAASNCSVVPVSRRWDLCGTWTCPRSTDRGY